MIAKMISDLQGVPKNWLIEKKPRTKIEGCGAKIINKNPLRAATLKFYIVIAMGESAKKMIWS